MILVSIISISSLVSAFDSEHLGQVGSIYLDDLWPLIEQTPKLKREFEEALSKSDKTHDICWGQRFPGAWEHLAGERVAPYHCEIGDQVLEIKAKVRLMGKNGKVYEKITPEAMRNAINISQTNLTWEWMTEISSPNK